MKRLHPPRVQVLAAGGGRISSAGTPPLNLRRWIFAVGFPRAARRLPRRAPAPPYHPPGPPPWPLNPRSGAKERRQSAERRRRPASGRPTGTLLALAAADSEIRLLPISSGGARPHRGPMAFFFLLWQGGCGLFRPRPPNRRGVGPVAPSRARGFLRTILYSLTDSGFLQPNSARRAGLELQVCLSSARCVLEIWTSCRNACCLFCIESFQKQRDRERKRETGARAAALPEYKMPFPNCRA